MRRMQATSSEAPPVSGSYSQGIRVGDFLFLTGQGPFDNQGNRVGVSVADQVRQALTNLDATARAEGGSITNAVRVGVYLRDLGDWEEMDEEYRKHFIEPLPARTAIQSNLIGFDVEIDAIVWLGDGANERA